MLSILPRRGKRAYESFVAALIKTENKFKTILSMQSMFVCLFV
jgi:hypothetical protein